MLKCMTWALASSESDAYKFCAGSADVTTTATMPCVFPLGVSLSRHLGTA